MSESRREETRAMYDTVAKAYARMLPDTGVEADDDLAMVRRFVASLRGRSPARVLDAGCGAGRMLTYLAALEPTLEMVGVDLSPAMVHEARVSHPYRDIVTGDLAALPFDTAWFDGVLAWYSIIHTSPESLVGIIDEVARVLRPGGSVLLGFQAGGGERTLPRVYGHDVPFHAFLHSPPHVEAALAAGGFTSIVRYTRPPRTSEHNAHAFVLATRQPPGC